jgi:glycosyltransferase involved in cell wall biosynthesis
MAPRSKADVIITVYPLASAVLDCVETLLEYSGDHLGRLILIDDCCLPSSFVENFEDLAGRDRRVRFVRHSARLGAMRAFNHVLADCEEDAVLLNGDCIVSENWLSELGAVAHSEERTACASPLMNGAGICSVPELNRELDPDETTAVKVRTACAGLPRWTVAPLLNASCIYLRRNVFDAVGLLNADCHSPCAAINDWVSRSQSLGFVAKRANHVYVHRVNAWVPEIGATASPDREPTQLGPGEAHIDHHVKKFCKSLDGRLPAHAIGIRLGGELRVGFDIRHLPREQVGTRTYAVCLANALAELPEIDLTLLVRHPDQAKGLKGRVVTPDQWADDVAVIHRPAQVIDAGDLQLLFESSAHIIITYQDLIGYRIPVTFSSDLEFDRYRATSSLSLPAVQRIIAYSESAGREITAEFGIPNEEVSVIPLGVETKWFAHREPFDETIRQHLRLPSRYFFSLATDFPHKNLPNLLDAYSIFRGRWRGSKPPGLVLAGHTSCARSGFYPNLESKPLAEGITFLGPVTSVQLKVLYQDAEALVFPSLYEGFGLPPLEAMAAGTPVIAMPISAVPEVGGDSVLYPDSLSPVDLARAMETVATNQYLRNDLRERGIRRAEQFRWENTARATLDVYRSAVMSPTPRSLQMRRNLREGISRWSMHASHEFMPQLMGILNVCRGFGLAFNMRLRRKLRMVPSQHRARFRLKQTANAGFPGRPSARRSVESSRQLS